MKGTEKPGTNEKRKREQHESKSGKNRRYKSLVFVQYENMRKRSNPVSVEELVFVNCITVAKTKSDY
jgi:hypothetical protein